MHNNNTSKQVNSLINCDKIKNQNEKISTKSNQ